MNQSVFQIYAIFIIYINLPLSDFVKTFISLVPSGRHTG